MNAEIVAAGTELVLGERINTNSAYLAAQLAEIGVTPVLHTIVGDDEEAFVAVLARAVEASDLVIITGGIGPTLDDITRQTVARVTGVPLLRDAKALEHIAGLFRSWGREMKPSNAVQADFPKGATVIDNPRGTAPGFRIRVGKCEIVVFPGVPSEMKPMWEASVRPTLVGASGEAVVARSINCFGAGESDITEAIKEMMVPGRNPLVGDTAEDAVIKVRIRARAATFEKASGLIEDDMKEIRSRLGLLVFGQDNDTLESVVAGLLISRGLKIAVAESCTGGLVSERLTDISGISAAFIQGVVAYSNESKTTLLGVAPKLIVDYGAVSEPVARAMAEGARKSAGADYGISVTGIAGPTGGTPEKPVGLVYVAVASRRGTTCRELRLRGDRGQVRDRATKHLLNILRLEMASGG
jgi:nicotinamide-nucleotide amidase